MAESKGASLPIVFIGGLFNVLPDERARGWFAPRVASSPDLLGYGAYADRRPDEISMESQADHVAALARGAGAKSAHFVGQSVGGVVAFLVAQRHPGLAASVISVEGNFTLGDAFWSQRLAAMEEEGVRQVLDGHRKSPASWLQSSGIEPTSANLKIAEWALGVPPLALRAMARAVIAATQGDRFVRLVESLLDRGLRVQLLAGERSRDGWSVPDSIARRAGGVQVLPGAGHLMMLEAPSAYFERIAALADGG
jgi:pimeloyl-ACP methyl ester carboxylesterase